DTTTTDGEDGVSSEVSDTRTTEDGDDGKCTTDPVEPPKENATADCDITVIIIGIVGIFGPYPYSPMQTACGAPPFSGPSPMYQMPFEQDMVLRATAYDAPLAARACEAIKTAQSLNTNGRCRVSVLLNGGYCYQFILTKSPTNTAIPYDITDVTPTSCPLGVFP
ncbi:hypothetical protein EG68_07051, partial [Paragonimus skrjabini miyazakii]